MSDETLTPAERERLTVASLRYAASGGAVRWETDGDALCISAVRPGGGKWQAAAALPAPGVESPVTYALRRNRRISAMYAAATGVRLEP